MSKKNETIGIVGLGVRVTAASNDSGGAFNEWHQVGVALEHHSTLTEQPRNVQMEYRIVAVNNGGNSVPSNTAAVVL